LRFHFPQGKPPNTAENESALKRAAAVFARLTGCVSIENMGDVMRAVGLPVYWKRPVFDAVSCTRNAVRPITFQDFANWWNGSVHTLLHFFLLVSPHMFSNNFVILISDSLLKLLN
jgi:hypothetical protein